jgi:hypothetical protein
MKKKFTSQPLFPQSNPPFTIDFPNPLNVIEFLFGNNKLLIVIILSATLRSVHVPLGRRSLTLSRTKSN